MAYSYVLFFTSAAAFRSEKTVKASGFSDARLVPTPRELSSDCGAALRIGAGTARPYGEKQAAELHVEELRVAELLTAAKIPYDRIDRVD